MQLQTHSFPTRRSSTLPGDPLRHQRGRRPLPRLVEPVTALARLEVQLQRPRPARARLAYETRGGIDRARGADRHEQVGAGKRMIDLVHPVRHLAEPDDVGAQSAGQAARGAGGPVDQRAGPRAALVAGGTPGRSEEHTSELQSLMRISYAVFCLKKK